MKQLIVDSSTFYDQGQNDGGIHVILNIFL